MFCYICTVQQIRGQRKARQVAVTQVDGTLLCAEHADPANLTVALQEIRGEG